MAKAQPIPDLDGEMTFALAGRRTVAVRARELAALSQDVLDTTGIERVHDMRVATRRLRAALELYEPCFAPKRHRWALGEVKRLADALGARRDPDVQLARVEAFASALAPDARAGLDRLEAELRAEQQQGNAELAKALKRARKRDVGKRLAKLAGAQS